MGRGEGSDSTQSPRSEGEIALLDADRLEDHAARAGGSIEDAIDDDSVYGTIDDDRVVKRLISTLSKLRATRHLDDDALEDRAIKLYNLYCDKIRAGDATDAETAHAAKLFGESVEHLTERLARENEETRTADMGPTGGGAEGLLKALRS